MGGLVEVELPRCSIAPLDRELDQAYWQMNGAYGLVSLKGGSWAIFHWNRLVTGRVLYRFQFKDELVIPQADVDLEELLAFLLDRGAVPDPQGWRLLKSVGLWTPPGTALLRPPRDCTGVVLTVAAPDDSDGVLSLQLHWKPEWDRRDAGSLPPFWMRLEQPRSGYDDVLVEAPSAVQLKGSLSSLKGRSISRENTLVAESTTESTVKTAAAAASAAAAGAASAAAAAKTPSLLSNIEEIKALVTTVDNSSVRFKMDQEQVKTVFFEKEDATMTGEQRDLSPLGETFGLWLICVAAALSQLQDAGGGGGGGGLWTFSIPNDVVTFARRKSIPCGVMVLLGLLKESDVPPWSSPPPPQGETTMETHERMEEDALARRLEAAMPVAQAAEARRVRMMRESQRFHTNHQKRIQAQEEYEQRRLVEAIQSPRLENHVIATAGLVYLVGENVVPAHYTVAQLAHAVLYLLLLDEKQAQAVADILERWTLWCQFGGMQPVQLTFLMENKVAFCYAAALVAVVRHANADDGNLSADLLASMRLWKRVRLG
ncbi:hypothetical protein ASPZODRAFT_137327 [Penicilliopsis zonata CBS 506.65]|uniref:Uncharacterized protein n=1 Tax=Penicilliopsis zonata CBS 506.65 TaxID=1073090 RepID=A0A1L9S5I7_9EURO|nr:hypothetical protein ASPZODRAFT_137327 [Penicilliopsis zonata CBS 506.65]OJJ42422.1 hypothetical protein ASPZODRAFT_137327 [Penicilliopsis zonata CBS 506.65]